VVRLCELPNNFRYVYESEQTLWDKMKTIATQVYGALDIVADSKIRGQIKALQEAGYGHYPVCVAKTQYSFSTDPKLRGAPSGHVVNIREVRLAAGAEFVVMICWRHHDHAGPAETAGRPTASTSTRTARSSGCFNGDILVS
jgi:formate--tetrahydrofolate ligase